jgi:TolA-binding protein
MASGDYGCTASLRLVHRSYDCGNNLAMLAPSNDTRVNLMLIMADAHPDKIKALLAANPPSQPDAPLFDWGDMANRFDPAAATDAQAAANGTVQNNDGKCPTTTDGKDRFVDAIKAERRLAPGEQDALLAARKAMRLNCQGDDTEKAIANAVKTAKTNPGKAFAQYLQGALYFWKSDYDKAASIFAVLSDADSPWVKEVSLYMGGRTAIKRAQLNAFDEYGSFNQDWKPDPKLIADAETAFDNYLRAYPQGDYAQSARGLKRRVYWLGGLKEKLAVEYGTLLVADRSERNVSDTELAQEIDNKLLPLPLEMVSDKEVQSPANRQTWSHNPAMLAVLDLYWMRTAVRGGSDSQPIPRAILEAQKPYFAGQMPLYEYLLAAYTFYVEKKPADVLHLIPDAARQKAFSYLQFSRQMLRGMALEAVKEHNALGFWMQMLGGATQPFQRPALELAIAYHHERAGSVSKVFDADSPVHYPLLREVLLSQVADAALLRKQAKDASAPQRERDIALFTLLYKEATRGHAADFLNDLSLVPPNAPLDGYLMIEDTLGREKPPVPLGLFTHAKNNGDYGCPSLRETEAKLAKAADDPTAVLCLADFLFANGVASAVDTKAPSEELGGTQSLFPGGPYVRMQAYQSVLANPKASADNKAYALYRAVRCYAPSGNNDCGGKDVPISQRKAWFLRLKHDYPSSRWARELKYYW